jgi:hypothetical protein
MVLHILPNTVWPICLLLACLALEASVLRRGIDDLDEGYFVQQGARVLYGQVPYRDFLSLYTPGLAYLHAGLFAVTGGPSLVAPRALSLFARAALALLLFVLARPLVRNVWWAAVPGVLLLLALDDAPVRWEPHPGWLSTFFALVAVWCLTHRPSTRWLLAAGAAAGLAYAFKQNTGVFILAAILIWCWYLCRRRAMIPAVAFVGVTLVWLVPLVISLNGDVSRLAVLVGAVNTSSLFAPPEPTILIPLAAILGGVWVLRRDSHPLLRWYLLAGVALFATQFPRMDTLHLAWSTPLLLVLGAVALSRLVWPVALVGLTLSLALLAPIWIGRLESLSEPLAPVAGVRAPLQTAADLHDLVADIQQRTAPSEPIFVYPTSPLVYVLADRPNPTRFDHLNPGAASPAQLQSLIADLQRSQTRLVVISDFWEAAWGPPGENAMLEDWLNTHYAEVAQHGAYRVLVPSGL